MFSVGGGHYAPSPEKEKAHPSLPLLRTDVYFFTDFNLIEISRLLDGSITTDVEVYYNVPWYLIFLKANIDAYLKQSIQDRLRITYQALREG